MIFTMLKETLFLLIILEERGYNTRRGKGKMMRLQDSLESLVCAKNMPKSLKTCYKNIKTSKLISVKKCPKSL